MYVYILYTYVHMLSIVGRCTKTMIMGALTRRAASDTDTDPTTDTASVLCRSFGFSLSRLITRSKRTYARSSTKCNRKRRLAISDNESNCKGAFFSILIFLLFFCYCLFLFLLSLSRSSNARGLFGYLSVLFSSFSVPLLLFFGSVQKKQQHVCFSYALVKIFLNVKINIKMKIELNFSVLFFLFVVFYDSCAPMFLNLNELSDESTLCSMQSIAVLPITCRFGGVSQTKPTGGRSQRFVLAGRQTHRRTARRRAGRQTD